MVSDAKFLKNLDGKLHKISKCSGSGSWKRHDFYVDEYTNENMSSNEIKKVLKIAKKINFVIYPINTSMGFSVGYDVCKISPTGAKNLLLRFKESQLPEGYNFKEMSKTFMNRSNRIKARLMGQNIVNDYNHYDY